MSDDPSPDADFSPYNTIINVLKRARVLLVQKAKADRYEEFSKTRAFLLKAYACFDPSDIPFDISRVGKDLIIHRDSLVSADIADIERSHELCIRVLEYLETHHPGFLSEVTLINGLPHKKAKPSPPRSVELSLSTNEQNLIMEKILEKPRTKAELVFEFGWHPYRDKCRGLRAYLRYLKRSGLIRSKGNTKSTIYYAIIPSNET